MSHHNQSDETGTKGARLIERACDVLEVVAASAGGARRATIIERTGMPRATVARILAVLTERGILHRDGERRVYSIGYGLLDMVQTGAAMPDLLAIAAPELRHLRHMTGETAYLAVLEGGAVVSIGKDEGAHPVRSAARLGGRKPLHCTSQGKSILALMAPDEQARMLARLTLDAVTDLTITDPRRLAAELAIVRARGFALDDEEVVRGVRCVGAPILTDGGEVVGAVSIAGPAWRLARERLEMLGPELAAAGRCIGTQLRKPAPAPTGLAEEVATGAPPAFHGLAPRWAPASGALWHGDALGPKVRHLHGGRDRELLATDEPLCGLELTAAGLVAVSAAGHAHLLSPGGTRPRPLRLALPGESAAATATAVRPDGSLWIASAARGEATIGAVGNDLAVTPSFALPHPIDALVWSRQGDRLFAASAAAGIVYVLEAGSAQRRILARIPNGSGRPTSLALDVEGGLWVALADGWAVARLNEIGEAERLLPMPVPSPTGLAFGGTDATRLFVATARHGPRLESVAAAPLAGRLFVLGTGIGGVPPPLVSGL